MNKRLKWALIAILLVLIFFISVYGVYTQQNGHPFNLADHSKSIIIWILCLSWVLMLIIVWIKALTAFFKAIKGIKLSSLEKYTIAIAILIVDIFMVLYIAIANSGRY